MLVAKWTSWILKNPEVIYILKNSEEIVGIITLLPFRPASEKFKQVLLGDTSILLGDVNISAKDDIEIYEKEKHVQLYLAEIGVKPSLSKSLRRKYGAKIISSFMDIMVNLGSKGVIIENFTAVGATKNGIKLLQHFGFSEILFPRTDTRVFTINMQASGAPLIRAYREALQNSTNLIFEKIWQ